MSDDKNVALVKKIYGLFSSGDIAGLLDQFTDDIDWETPGAPRVPYAGRFRGRQEVARFFANLGRTAAFEAFEPQEFIPHGDRVIVLGRYAGKGRETGRAFSSKWAMVFTIRDGKVSAFHEYLDTANLGAAFS